MERSVILPDRRRLLRGAVLNIAGCTVALIMAQRLSVPGGNVLGAALFACGAGAFAVNVSRTLWMLIMRTPAFAADDIGFAVLGGRRHPWSQYRRTRIERIPGMLPLRRVVIEYETARFARIERLPAYALPEVPLKFAQRVEAMAAKKKWIADLASEPDGVATEAPRTPLGSLALASHLHRPRLAPVGSERMGRQG